MAQGFWNKVGNMFLRNTGLQKPGNIDSFKGAGSKKTKSTKSTKNDKTYVIAPYDSDSIYKSLGGGAKASDYSSGGGGGYAVSKGDISGLLKSYEQAAAANRQNAKSTYDTTRSDLLTSLKRFQEQNAKDVQNQKQSYLAEQSGLESARESANRQSRISASARGLGGSGLQQLAQLQNLLGQSEEISKAAGQNQSAMDKLALALTQKQEDTDTNIAKALKTYNDAIASINSNLAVQKAQAIEQNEREYRNALNQARAQAAASASNASSMAREVNASARAAADQIINRLTGINTNLEKTLKGLNSSKKKDKQAAMHASNVALNELLAINNDVGLDAATYKRAKNNINKLLYNYNFINSIK